MIPGDQSDELPQILDKLQRGERVVHFEIDRVRKDGRKIDVSLSISPVRDASGRTIAASTIARDFTERKLAEGHRNALMGELDHRVKNMLMIISSIIAQTLRSTTSPEMFGKIIEGRIQALSRVHSLLNQHDQSHAELRDDVAGNSLRTTLERTSGFSSGGRTGCA